MYFGALVVGMASTIGIEISPTTPLIFTGEVKKCKIWRCLKHDSTLSRPCLEMQQDIRNLKQKCNAAIIAYVLAKFGEVGSMHRWETSVSSAPTPKIAREKTQLWIIRFRSNFVQSLNTGHPKCCRSSRSRAQRWRSQPQHEITCKNWSRNIWCTMNFQGQQVRGQGHSMT